MDINENDYTVELVPTDSITPSPENDDLYGEVDYDEQMEALIESIRSRGLEEPIIVAADGFIISGHRRYFACCRLGLEKIPIRRKADARGELLDQWPRILAEYNPQRVKSASSQLKEALLRFEDDDPAEALLQRNLSSRAVEAEYLRVEGCKEVPEISEKKQAFLKAAVAVVESLRDFWPLSVRQIHYQLLNNPPLISEPKQSRYDTEHYRYRNDQRSYGALVELLKSARYRGHLPMDCIDDPTRPCYAAVGFSSASEFIQWEVDEFLCDYRLNHQLNQPRHIEVLGEKNTLMQIIRPVCEEFCVPLSLGRGYGSIPIWRDMAKRYYSSGKERMTLIVASDFDPEGFDLADDAVRSLRDLFLIPVDHHRVAVKREQIEELELVADFNAAKETSSRRDSFIERTGGEQTWELEALPPTYLQDQLRSAIESNMDSEIFERSIQQEHDDASELQEIRRSIALDLGA